MIAENWLSISAASVAKPSAFPAGTLLAMVPLSKKGAPISWAIRFDDASGAATTQCLYLIDGSPLGPDGDSNIVRCQDFHVDELAAIGMQSPNFAIEIEANPQDWVPESEMLWHYAKAHVALGDFGARLCGYDRYRAGGAHVWIDCKTWQSDLEVIKLVGQRTSLPAAYAKTWRVVARRSADDAIVIPYRGPGKEA